MAAVLIGPLLAGEAGAQPAVPAPDADEPVSLVIADSQLRTDPEAGLVLAFNGAQVEADLSALSGSPDTVLNFEATGPDDLFVAQNQLPPAKVPTGTPPPAALDRVFVCPPGCNKPAIVVPGSWIPDKTSTPNNPDTGGILYKNPNNPKEQVRIMPQSTRNPDGYIRVTNPGGQPLDPRTGKPGSQADTHVDIHFKGRINIILRGLTNIFLNTPVFTVPGQDLMFDNIRRCGAPECGPAFDRTQTSLPTGRTLLSDASLGGLSLTGFGGPEAGQIAGYPLTVAGSDLFGNLESSPYLVDSDLDLPTFRFDKGYQELFVDSFDKGVDFKDIRFTGMVIDPASRAPFFRAELTPVTGTEPGALDDAELRSRTDRFTQYFLEGIAMRSNDLSVSLESGSTPDGTRTAQIAIPDNLRRTSAGRVMVENDITMKRDFLATVVRGDEETVNDGVNGMWTSLLSTSPNYGALLKRGLPGIAVSTAAEIQGAPATVTRDDGPGGSGARVTSAPLGMGTLLEQCETVLSPGTEQYAAEVESLRNTMCAQVQQRITALTPAFIAKLNTAAEYEELRLVYNALAQAKLYKDLTQGQSTPYSRYLNTGVLPPGSAPVAEFPEADLLARITTAGTDRFELPCGTDETGVQVCPAGPQSIEVFGGVNLGAPPPVEKPADNADLVSTLGSTTAAVIQENGNYAINVGTRIPRDLPEYAVSVDGTPKGGNVSVVTRNVGGAAPSSSLLQVYDIALGADGKEIRRTLAHSSVTAPLAPGAAPARVEFTCASCSTPVDGATRRVLVARTTLGTGSESTWTVEPELVPNNDAAKQFPNG